MAEIPSLEPSLAKIDRAEQHILNLDQIFAQFINRPPYTFIRQADPNPNVRAFEITTVEDVGLPMRVLVGEIAHHLRSAFDLLVYQLMLNAGVSDPKRLKHCAFPVVTELDISIPKKLQEYEDTMRRKIEGIHPVAATYIKDLQPWKSNGADSFLAQIDWLDNTDKHRLLLAAVCGVKIGGFNFRNVDGSVTLMPHNAVVPLEAGAVVKTELPQPEMDMDLAGRLRLQVTFNEPGVFRRKPVIPKLQELSDFARVTIKLFDRCFTGTT
jgi:hypothetical protein